MLNNNYQRILIKFGIWLAILIFTCIVGISGVFADTYTNIGDKSDITVVLLSTAYSDAPFNVPKGSAYNFYQVTAIDINLDNYNFEANKNYQLELDLTNQTITNANYYSVTGYNGEKCLISYERDKTHFDGQYPRWAFECPHSTNHINITVSNSNGQYLWEQQQTNTFKWVYSYLRYSTTSLSSNGNNNDDIINNQNQNTQSIINNQNQNTQDIINNQNNNSEKEIESQKVCLDLPISKYTIIGSLDSSGKVVNNSNFFVTDYIDIEYVKNLYLKEKVDSGNSYLCFYDINKTKIGNCISQNNISVGYKIQPPDGSKYIRATLKKSVQRPIWGGYCENGNQALNDSLNDDDTTGATSEASDFFSSFNTNTFGLTSIITAPLNLIQSLTSSTCSELHLPLPYLNNKYLDLPCMTSIYQTHFGSFFTMYQTITYGIIAYWVCVRIFNQVKDFKNPEHDEIEVVDL